MPFLYATYMIVPYGEKTGTEEEGEWRGKKREMRERGWEGRKLAYTHFLNESYAPDPSHPAPTM